MSQPAAAACPAASRVIDRIKSEHLALARIIAAMQAWVVQAREPGAARDAQLFEAMLRYVAEVPDRVHHPQEDAALFPAVASLAQGRAIVAGLEREHAAGGPMLQAVGAAFEALRAGAPNALNRLSTAVDEFAEFYWAHMRKEEEELLPLAAAALPEAEWARIERSFASVDDPLFGSAPAEAYRELLRFIAGRTTGPLHRYVQEAAAARGA